MCLLNSTQRRLLRLDQLTCCSIMLDRVVESALPSSMNHRRKSGVSLWKYRYSVQCACRGLSYPPCVREVDGLSTCPAMPLLSVTPVWWTMPPPSSGLSDSLVHSPASWHPME